MLFFSIAVPSEAPSKFSVTSKSSTSITATWELPLLGSRNGIIKGFKLYYKKKGSSGSQTMIPINSNLTLTKDVTSLAKYTEYELQVLAFTSVGDGKKSTERVVWTMQDGNRYCNFLLTVTCLGQGQTSHFT